VREKYCWLAGGCWLVLNWYERKTLLAGWESASRTRRSSQVLSISHKKKTSLEQLGPCLVAKKFYKIFQYSPSHRIFDTRIKY
jgi:hypothetical protein